MKKEVILFLVVISCIFYFTGSIYAYENELDFDCEAKVYKTEDQVSVSMTRNNTDRVDIKIKIEFFDSSGNYLAFSRKEYGFGNTNNRKFYKKYDYSSFKNKEEINIIKVQFNVDGKVIDTKEIKVEQISCHASISNSYNYKKVRAAIKRVSKETVNMRVIMRFYDSAGKYLKSSYKSFKNKNTNDREYSVTYDFSTYEFKDKMYMVEVKFFLDDNLIDIKELEVPNN
ncbi:hypothetical protein [Vallitalea guaymasensis]|uniref:hypothetical protein n=1 Tax=Vallitalea guaymasensis TaxID=1185412 RepID=UPI000DE40605|nr:hypothetical protein [Vallitalea guaymasensis]